MNAKTWGQIAGAVIATVSLMKLIGFVTPESRAEKVEKTVEARKGEEKELRDELRGLSTRTTTLEANYQSLDRKVTEGTNRVENKLDKLIELQLRRR